MEWDGNDDFGAPVAGKGTYIYKVLVKSQNQEKKCKGTALFSRKISDFKIEKQNMKLTKNSF